MMKEADILSPQEMSYPTVMPGSSYGTQTFTIFVFLIVTVTTPILLTRVTIILFGTNERTGTNCTVTDITYVTNGNWPAAAKKIMANAGTISKAH